MRTPHCWSILRYSKCCFQEERVFLGSRRWWYTAQRSDCVHCWKSRRAPEIGKYSQIAQTRRCCRYGDVIVRPLPLSISHWRYFRASRAIIKDVRLTVLNLAQNNGRRIANSTPEKELQSLVSVGLSPGAADGEESKQTVLNHANLEHPSSKRARKSFSCFSSQLWRFYTGTCKCRGAVHSLAENRYHGNHENAWQKYDNDR